MAATRDDVVRAMERAVWSASGWKISAAAVDGVMALVDQLTDQQPVSAPVDITLLRWCRACASILPKTAFRTDTRNGRLRSDCRTCENTGRRARRSRDRRRGERSRQQEAA